MGDSNTKPQNNKELNSKNLSADTLHVGNVFPVDPTYIDCNKQINNTEN